MHLVLQPCASKIAQEHFAKTIENNLLTFNYIEGLLAKTDYLALLNIYGSHCLHIWGVTKTSYKQWSKMQVGDVVLFSKNKEIFSYGVVCYKLHNADIADKLWGKTIDGDSWEYIYFLDEVKSISIPYINFNKIVGYADNFVIQGFSVLDEEKTEKFLNVYPLQSKVFMSLVKEEEYNECINNPLLNMDSLDKEILSKQRKEQTFLRQELFKGKINAVCAICGKKYPVSFLCCSHIKKRSECTLEEKKDYNNIVIPMCDFGCDKLYEDGFIGVEDGMVKILKYTGLLSVDEYLKNLEGKKVFGYNERNKKYFEQHLKKNSREGQ